MKIIARQPRSTPRGFVILEVLIGVSLTAVVLGTLSYYQGFVTLQSSRTLQLTQATQLMRYELANIRRINNADPTGAAYNNLAPSGPTPLPAPTDATIAQSTQFSKVVKVDDQAPALAVKTVRVTISWRDATAQDQSVTGATVLSQP